MQTDPIGYADQMNLYAYVGNDPLNMVDPSGSCSAMYRGYVECWWKYIGVPAAKEAAPQVAYTVLSFTPVIGDGMAIHEYSKDPSWTGAGILAVSMVPGGDAVKPPKRLSRVVPANSPVKSLGRTDTDATHVFVTTPEAIDGKSASEIADQLELGFDPSTTGGIRVIEFDTPTEGLAVPFNQDELYELFTGGGTTSGGLPEYLVPNRPIRQSDNITVIK